MFRHCGADTEACVGVGVGVWVWVWVCVCVCVCMCVCVCVCVCDLAPRLWSTNPMILVLPNPKINLDYLPSYDTTVGGTEHASSGWLVDAETNRWGHSNVMK